MTEHTVRYIKIAIALVVIFLAGKGAGWMWASLDKKGTDADVGTVQNDPAAWKKKMLARLTEELDLTPVQVTAIEPILDDTAMRIWTERERALFQIHLNVLAVHDKIASELDDRQKPEFLKSHEALRKKINTRFKDLLAVPQAPNPPKAP